MLAKLRATNIDQVRQVANMPSKEADRCVNADTAEEATRLRQPGCDVVCKLYGEIAGSMGFDAAVVSEKIKATFADFSKSQIRNAGQPAHYNSIKEDLLRSLLGVESPPKGDVSTH